MADKVSVPPIPESSEEAIKRYLAAGNKITKVQPQAAGGRNYHKPIVRAAKM